MKYPPESHPRRGRFGELIPTGGFSRWKQRGGLDESLHGSSWRSHDGLLVVSSLNELRLPGSEHEIGPTWFVSASRMVDGHEQRRPSDEDMTRVVYRFNMPAYDEDNHYPGVHRGLFCPIEGRWRNQCECQLIERIVVEPDGYQWTTDDSEGCRGCDYERMFGRRCNLHA